MRQGKLEAYRRKRDFRQTPEPRGRANASGEGRRFVVHRHAARRLHFDLRLELGGVLKSWAVTKEPSLDPAVRRLAVRTEDHPIEYADFKGVIPEGYGAGTVEIWDRGEWWSEDDDPQEALDKGALHFVLDGDRLSGAFILVRIKYDKRQSRQEHWLLIRRRGEERRPRVDALSFIPPQLATLADEAPDGAGWLHEVKFDGYRLQAIVKRGVCRLFTRNGIDWTERYPKIAGAFSALDVDSVVVDGELVALGADGRTSFGALCKGGATDALACCVFDLLHLDGEDWRARPLIDRKSRLEALLAKGPPALRFSAHVTGRGRDYARAACAMALEGVVSKRCDAPYVSGRSKDWIKIKCRNVDEFVVAGWRQSATKGRPFASLIVGEYVDGVLRYRGHVGSGFDDRALDDLSRRLRSAECADPQITDVPMIEARDARWTRPNIVAEIAFAERTGSGVLRQATFIGIREDKRPAEVARSSTPRGRPDSETFLGVRFTHPHRVMYPDVGVTKREIAAHYADLSALILPHAKGRPTSLVRCPGGVGEKCFFQKHPAAAAPPELASMPVVNSEGVEKNYLVISDRKGLVAGVQSGAVEFHTWGSRGDLIEKPDRLVFDLDPDEAVRFSAVRDAAFGVREALAEWGLASFPMLTGGKGVHVVAPIARTRVWTDVKAFCWGLAETLAAAAPALFVAEMSKQRRKGRIFLDWMRNQRGATAVMPLALRARPGAPVAAPVSWKELETANTAAMFTLQTIRTRVDAAGYDPWAGYFQMKQSLSRSALDRFAVV